MHQQYEKPIKLHGYTHIKIPKPSSPSVDGSGAHPPLLTSQQDCGYEVSPRRNSTRSFLDGEQPLDPKTFPDQPRPGTSQVLATIPNTRHLLDSYKITARYNVIRKKLSISLPNYRGTPDNADNVAMTQIISLANLNALPTGQIPSFVDTIADENQFNPVADWITSKPWDGVNRLPAIYATLAHKEGFPDGLKEQLIYRWLLSAVAAALTPSGFRCRGVLTMQGAQSIGKTAWVNALVPDEILRESVVKIDHYLDAGNKDSLLTAVSHWLVEMGELEGSLRKDLARLKGFLTSDRDKMRRPYARTDSEYPRRTVFCATVNDPEFLVDSTGNSRWWTIPVTKINHKHGIDMQQLFAQLAIRFQDGEQWWLTSEEEKLLENQNNNHRKISAVRDRIMGIVDLDALDGSNHPALTPTELLRKIGIPNPSNPQAKECAAVLRELFGDSKRIRGQDKWRVPVKTESWSPSLDVVTSASEEY